MNYLAHAYLSFGIPELLAGNMISDFVKGKRKFQYPDKILTGIELHREIDSFTDSHPATIAAKKLFQDPYRLYSGAFIDIVYDHFLATDPQIFTGQALMNFSLDTYRHLDDFQHLFPENFLALFPYMKEHNWLYNYQYKWGIGNSFAGLVRRAKFLSSSSEAIRIFEDHYFELQSYYRDFFPELAGFTAERIRSIESGQWPWRAPA